MIAPKTPADENTRISTLRSLNILDTSPEERFDRLTRLARRLFGVPIALVSLVDADRQWFKSKMGIEVGELPRSESFCGHAILDDDIMIIPNALIEDRFRDNPLVTGDPHIRFYAGCPLQVGNGSRLGTLCLIDREPREFSDEDYEMLRDLARMAEQELAAVQLATMDELTMLSNRRGFEALGHHAYALSHRMGKPMVVAFIDLDDFKPINDTFGHAEGDRVLAKFAGLLRECFRESDVIGRMGGDEFAIVMTDMDEVKAEKAISRLQAAVTDYWDSEARGYTVGFSVGIRPVDFTRHTGLASVLAEADGLMYGAKQERSPRSR